MKKVLVVMVAILLGIVLIPSVATAGTTHDVWFAEGTTRCAFETTLQLANSSPSIQRVKTCLYFDYVQSV